MAQAKAVADIWKAPYKFDKDGVIVVLHHHLGKNIRTAPAEDGSLDADGGIGKRAQWKVSVTRDNGKVTAKFCNEKTGDYLRISKNGERINGGGKGKDACEFTVHRMGGAVVKLESVISPGSYVAVSKGGVIVGKGGPRCRIEVLKQGLQNITGIGPVISWQRCSGDSLKWCKEGMKGVEKDVLNKLQQFKILEYKPCDKGICLLGFGYQVFIGVVTLAVNLGPILYGSIRVSRVVGTEKPQPWKLEGFIISEYDGLLMVENGQYHIWMGNQRFPKNWIPCNGDIIKNAMNNIKKDFLQTAELYGFKQINGDKGYEPSSYGIELPTTAGIGVNCYIGFVKLSTKDEPGFYFASIKVSQLQEVMPPQPFKLLGFIISRKPFLKFVADGVHRIPQRSVVVPAVTQDDDVKSSADNDSNNNDNNNNTLNAVLGNYGMQYIPTGPIQKIVDGFKSGIQQMAGISGDLDTFQVVCATACLNPYATKSFGMFVKIYIGIDDITNFTNFIYVRLNYGGIFEGQFAIYLASAQTFPF